MEVFGDILGEVIILLRFTKVGNKYNISAISGNLKVFNNVSSVKLNSGQRLYQIQKNDFLPQKISKINFPKISSDFKMFESQETYVLDESPTKTCASLLFNSLS